MIPKVIHYCWFGRNPLPPLVEKCIASWKKLMPDYEIKLWNEDNFDVNINPYTKEAYKNKKYAFVSDFARFWIIYNYGGIYFDTDVELIKPIDDIISEGAFMACEKDCIKELYYPSVAPGLVLAAEKGHTIYKELIEKYNSLSFLNHDGSLNLKTVDQYTTEILIKHGLKKVFDKIQIVEGINIYPGEYFCPISSVTKRLRITENTRAIHIYTATWSNRSFKHNIIRFIRSLLPDSALLWWNEKKRQKQIKKFEQ